MKVALIGRYRVPYPFSEHALDYPMLQALAGEMEELHVLVQGASAHDRYWGNRNLNVHYAPTAGGPVFLVWAMRKVRALHRRAPVHVVNGSDLWGGVVGLALRRGLGVKVLVQLQGEFLPPNVVAHSPLRRVVLHRLARVVCRHADLVRCLYADAADRVGALGVSSERIAIVPSRCNVALFDPNRFPPRLRGERRAMYVGNLIAGKGVSELLRAFADLAPRLPGATLTIVGEGPSAGVLQHEAIRLRIDGQVRFLGRRRHDDLPELLHGADVLVLPSFSEATPRVVLEAMAMELPVVATRVGGLAEMVQDGRTGLLVPAGDPHALSAAIERTLTDQAWARRAGQLGRRRVVSTFTLERHVQLMAGLHRRLIMEVDGVRTPGDARRAV